VTVKCSNPEQLVITVRDPCTVTSILSDIFPDVMTASQLTTDSLNIGAAMPPNTWPWISAVDNQSGFTVPSLCGEIVYDVLLNVPAGQYTSDPNGMVITDPVTTLTYYYNPTTLVVQIPGASATDFQLLLQPDLNYLGPYGLILRGTLVNYGIYVTQPFSVMVTDCVATLDISAINPADLYLENWWYSSAQTLDLTPLYTSSDIVQTPACGYDYSFAAYWVPQGETDLY